MSKHTDQLDEISARVRRIETRQMRIAIAQGVDPTGGKQRLVLLDKLPPTFETSGLDISLADLLTACDANGITGSVLLMHNGAVVGSFEPSPKE